MTCGTQSCMTTSPVSSRFNLTTFWSFNSNTFDFFNISHAIAVNNPMYFPGYTTKGQCILFNGINQYAIAPFIPLNNRSFTIELFVFLNSFSSKTMISIFSQCAILNENNRCLHLSIVNSTLFFDFSGDNVLGKTRLVPSQW